MLSGGTGNVCVFKYNSWTYVTSDLCRTVSVNENMFFLDVSLFHKFDQKDTSNNSQADAKMKQHLDACCLLVSWALN